VKNPFDVSRKIVMVTGGIGRLGRHFTRALVRGGARVAVLDNAEFPSGLDRFLEVPYGRKSFFFARTDVTSRASLEKALSAVEKRWGRPQGLINAAALDSPPDSPAEANGPFENYPAGEWDRVMDVNLKGVFQACQVVGGAMAKNGSGSIVNVNSVYGMVSPDQRIYGYRSKGGKQFFKPAAYSASKSALLNLTRYLATYWAARNVRVNNLTLGGVLDGQDPRFLKGYAGRVPMGRMAKPDEYDGAVLFLLSNASSYMTGSNLVIDGGWTAW